jgi:predicted Zn-dependent protease
MNFYYVDTYKNVDECISKAEILFKDRSEYMCLPNNGLNQQRIVKGVFHKDLLKNNK